MGALTLRKKLRSFSTKEYRFEVYRKPLLTKKKIQFMYAVTVRATLGFLLRMCLVTSEAKVEAKFSFAIEDFSLFHVLLYCQIKMSNLISTRAKFASENCQARARVLRPLPLVNLEVHEAERGDVNLEVSRVLQVAGGAALTVGIWLFADRSSFTNLIGKLDQSDILVSERMQIN